jgi:hypothetical protein
LLLFAFSTLQLPCQLPPGHYRHNLETLALLVNGLVASGHTHLIRLATKAPLTCRVENRVARLKRWLSNKGQLSQDQHLATLCTILEGHHL